VPLKWVVVVWAWANTGSGTATAASDASSALIRDAAKGRDDYGMTRSPGRQAKLARDWLLMLNVTPDGYGAIGRADRNPTATFIVTLSCSP
jgi:hypothetical protein